MNKNLIRVYFEPKSMTLIDRAKFIVEKQNEISKHLNKFNWLLFDKTPVDVRQSEDIVALFLKRIKKRIRAHTVLKNIPDDFLDDIDTSEGFYASKELDDDASFTYTIGIVDKNKYAASLIIKNYHCLNGLNDLSELKEFVKVLVRVFNPYSIESSEFAFYRELMDLKTFEYWFGGLTFFSKKIKIPQIPPEIRVEELSNGGRLLISTDQIFSTENPEHVKNARLLVDLFRKHNVRTTDR